MAGVGACSSDLQLPTGQRPVVFDYQDRSITRRCVAHEAPIGISTSALLNEIDFRASDHHIAVDHLRDVEIVAMQSYHMRRIAYVVPGPAQLPWDRTAYWPVCSVGGRAWARHVVRGGGHRRGSYWLGSGRGSRCDGCARAARREDHDRDQARPGPCERGHCAASLV